MLKRAFVLALCAALPAASLAGGWGSRHHFASHYHYGYGYNGGDSDALIAGLVIGGLLGWMISEDRHYRRHAYPVYSYRDTSNYTRYYGPVRGAYYRRPEIVRRQYVSVRPAPPPRVVRRDPAFSGRQCLMTREYTTTIEIDGERREAYGTRCLAADGSWVLGTPKLAPQFD